MIGIIILQIKKIIAKNKFILKKILIKILKTNLQLFKIDLTLNKDLRVLQIFIFLHKIMRNQQMLIKYKLYKKILKIKKL